MILSHAHMCTHTHTHTRTRALTCATCNQFPERSSSLPGHRTIVLDVPLLLKFPFLRRLCLSAVLVVLVSPEKQLARLMARNTLTEEEAQKKIASQLSAEAQRKLADFVIENDGSLEELRRSVADLQREAPAGWPAARVAAAGAVAASLGASTSIAAAKAGATTCSSALFGCVGAAAAAVCMSRPST
ncbi:dcakd [Symbiodinium natans]|uniref:Dcakd protein n=1 Tax=Symbiodinium natans TaxID=878477 RepID=A0A812PL60_9DINO|nr:dcakd [Symbiodinium natans]